MCNGGGGEGLKHFVLLKGGRSIHLSSPLAQSCQPSSPLRPLGLPLATPYPAGPDRSLQFGIALIHRNSTLHSTTLVVE